MNLITRSAAAMVSLLLAGSAIAQDLETDAEKLGYLIGMDIGTSLRQQGNEIDLEQMFAAIRATYNGETPAMTQEEAQALRQAFMQQRQAEAQAAQQEAAAQNLAEGEAFLATNASADGVQVTDSGLQYRVVESADGARPSAEDRVTVHYRGTLLDGTEFDSSYERGQPVTFALNQVIPGWTEGVQLMPVGSTYEFWIPSELAYGQSGTPGGPIGPNETLHFTVELISVE